jgi:hypothetical protein
MSKFFLFVLISYFLSYTFLQSDDVNEQKIKEANWYKLLEENAFKDSIDGVYIPKDLYEAMDILDSVSSNEDREIIKTYLKNDNLRDLPILKFNIISDSWKLKNNSRIARYLDSFGILHFESKYHYFNWAFAYYLIDSSLYLKVHNYHNFIEDGNLFLYMYYKSSGENNFYSLNLNILKADTLGRTTFYCPFEQSEFISYKHDNPDALLNDFRLKLYDYSSHDFLDTLSVFFKQHGYLFQGGYSLDSLLFIKDPNSNDIEYFLNAFKQYINKDSLINEMKVEKYNIYYNVGKSELDSIDNILYQYNKKAIEDNYYDDNDKWTDFYNIVMKDYLAKKLILDLYVIRFYPYIEFDFKEYKRKKRR